MALEGSDLLVVQKQSGDLGMRKLSVTDLQAFLDTGPVINFKGTANGTVLADEPEASDRVAGNLYINSATTAGTFAWVGGTAPYTGTIQPNAQIIWVNTTGWAVTNNGGADLGVETVSGAVPITVNSSDAANPIVSVSDATTSAVGVVQLATATDVSNGTVGVVVTAAQLKDTNDAIDDAGGGTVTNVTGSAPIVITGNSNSVPNVTVTAASTSDAGVVVLEDASALDITSTSTAATPKYVDDYYLIKDFSSLADVDA